MLSGIKCDKLRINLNDLARDARHLKRYAFREALFVCFMVPFLFDPDRFLSFFCKTKPSCEFNFELSMFSFVQVLPMAGDSFLECTS